MLKKDLKALQTKWYSKLKSEGFKDIEDKNQEYLKEWHSSYFDIRYDPLSFDHTTEYYRRCGHFLFEHKFKTEKEKTIWQYHAQGKSISEVAKLMSLKRWFVHRTVQWLQSIVRGENHWHQLTFSYLQD